MLAPTTAKDPPCTVSAYVPGPRQFGVAVAGHAVRPSGVLFGSYDHVAPGRIAAGALRFTVAPAEVRKVRLGAASKVPAFCTSTRVVRATPSAFRATAGR